MTRPSQPISVVERALQLVQDVLRAAGTDAGDFVFRGRVDPHSIEELPSINLRRGNGLIEAFGQGVDRGIQEFDLDHLVRGDEWETASDALHAQAHAALLADEQLARMCKGLRCIRTEMRAQAADDTRGTLTATYQFQSLQFASDVTRHP